MRRLLAGLGIVGVLWASIGWAQNQGRGGPNTAVTGLPSASNSPTDGDCYTYQASTQDGLWGSCASGAGGAPTNATYITQTANSTLSNEQALSALGTGLMSNTNGTGVVSIYAGATCSSQFVRALSAAGAATCESIGTGDITDGTITGNDIAASIGGRSLTLNTGTTPDQLDADAELYERTNALTIPTPTSADDVLWFRAERAMTVTGIDCLVGAATSAEATVNECDANGANCVAIEAAITCATTNTTESGGIDNAAVDAGDYVRVDVGTVTGTVGQLIVNLTFTVDD